MCVCVCGGGGGGSVADRFQHMRLPMPAYLPLPTLDPDVGGSHDGKHEEKEDEYEGLQIIGCHSLHTIKDRTK